MRMVEWKAHLIAPIAVLCFFAGVGSQMAYAQKPTSGAMLTISGTAGGTPVNITIYDSQIHSGVVQPVPIMNSDINTSNCNSSDATFPTDAYVLQGGSWTGCDPGDAFEVTDVTGGGSNNNTHERPGKVDLSGFHIETHYVCAGSCSGGINGTGGMCNTSGTICTSAGGPDSGFLTVTNNTGSAFTGTITLQGTSPIAGGSFCPASVVEGGPGVASDSWTAGLAASGAGVSVTLTLGTQGTLAAPGQTDSSNCGGFNAPQTLPLNAGTTSTFPIGNDIYSISPINSASGDTWTVLPVPVPAGPVGPVTESSPYGTFGSEALLFPTSPFSATNFPGQAIIPFADLSVPGNPVGMELQFTCTPGNPESSDCFTFLSTYQISYGIDANSFPSGVGGPHFLGEHDNSPVGYPGLCPTTGFNIDTLLSYSVPPSDAITLGGSSGNSCFAATFDPAAAPVPAGTTISIFAGFQSPVVNDSPGNPVLNLVKAGRVVPLKWQQSLSSGAPNTGLSWCQTGSSSATPAVCNDTTPIVQAPWVFLSRIPMVCPNGAVDSITTDTAIDSNSSGFQNFGNGSYQFNWQTMKTDTGCATVVLQFDSSLSVAPANFQFTN